MSAFEIYKKVLPLRLFDILHRYRFLSSLPPQISSIIKSIKPGDICIDCGANIGRVSMVFSSYGATVYAFEPDPAPAQVLKSHFKGHGNVCISDAAVGVNNSEVIRLYLHKDAALDPVKFSQGSSLLYSKPNVGSQYIDVRTVDLAAFIKRLGAVKILKVDIEGFETQLIPDLINRGALDFVDYVFVETHHRKWESLVEATNRMCDLISSSKYKQKIWLDWV
jgi:FkbM family methyltransferase